MHTPMAGRDIFLDDGADTFPIDFFGFGRAWRRYWIEATGVRVSDRAATASPPWPCWLAESRNTADAILHLLVLRLGIHLAHCPLWLDWAWHPEGGEQARPVGLHHRHIPAQRDALWRVLAKVQGGVPRWTGRPTSSGAFGDRDAFLGAVRTAAADRTVRRRDTTQKAAAEFFDRQPDFGPGSVSLSREVDFCGGNPGGGAVVAYGWVWCVGSHN